MVVPVSGPEYHANYYGAFVFDPDGNNAEAVCHMPEVSQGLSARNSAVRRCKAPAASRQPSRLVLGSFFVA